MRHDILREIHAGALSADEARAVIDEILGSPAAPTVESILSLSRREWTAFGQGASLGEVARWRYRGWPRRCIICRLGIDVDRFGWKVVQADGDSALMHNRCRGLPPVT